MKVFRRWKNLFLVFWTITTLLYYIFHRLNRDLVHPQHTLSIGHNQQFNNQIFGELKISKNGNRYYVDTCWEKYEDVIKPEEQLWDSKYKNPCFERDGGLHCTPYFYVIGFPKCATTDLYARISRHPHFVPPYQKELHWISRMRFYSKFGRKRIKKFGKFPTEDLFDINRYTKSFSYISRLLIDSNSQNDSKAVTGDFSPSTIWDNDMYKYFGENPDFQIRHYIRKINPCAKFIVAMRDPVNRLYSDFYRAYQDSNIDNPDEVFHRKVKQVLQIYKECEETKTLDQCIHSDNYLAKQNLTTNEIRIKLGAYVVFILDWLKTFPRDQMLFIKMEDYAKDLRTNLEEIFSFLDFETLQDDAMDAIVAFKPTNARVDRNQTYKPMLEETRQLLKEFYRPFNQRLSELLQDTKFLWDS